MTLFQPSKGKLACRLEVIEALRLLPERLSEEVAGLSEEQLRFRPGEGQWSLKEVIGHLRDFADIDHDRLVRMITQERPVLPGYEQEDLAREHSYQDADLHAVLEELASIRQETVHVLTELVDANWARTGRHLERGIFSIRQHVEHIVDHEALHLEHVGALKEQARGQRPGS